jgi:hypothetical protein
MLRTLPWILIGAGALINIADAFTAGTAGADPKQGYFYGTHGVLKAVNDALPVNFGVALMIAGGGLLAWRELR